MDAKAILFTDVDTVTVGTAEVPSPGFGEALVEARFTCISPGTELRSLAGLQVRSGPFPFVPGYQMAGVVVQVGPEACVPVGARVFCSGTQKLIGPGRCWGAHMSHAVVDAASLSEIPDGVDLLDASICKLAAIAYHGFAMSRPKPCEKVAVVGLGPLGQLSARLHAMTGAHVVAADLSPERVTLARESGLAALVPTGSLVDSFNLAFPGGADIVVDVTGKPEVLRESTKIARVKNWGNPSEDAVRLVLQGSFPDTFQLSYDDIFRRELTLLTPRDQLSSDIVHVFDLLTRKRLTVGDLISDVRPVSQAPETYAELREARANLLTVAFDWQRS